MIIEDEYRKIGKAVIDECIEREDERSITIALRSIQHNGKLYIRMDDRIGILSVWASSDLEAIRTVNRARAAKERADALAKKIKDSSSGPEELPQVVIVK